MADAPAELSTLLSGLLFETVTLIEPDELTGKERALVPDWWMEAVRLPARDGLERALAVWQSTIPDELPGFHAVLREHGLGVFMGRSSSAHKPLLAYAAQPPVGEPLCWYGFPPTRELRHSTLDLAELPMGPRNLYTQLHDGFKLAFAFHNGFPCSTELLAVGDDLDADSVEITGSGPVPDLNHLVALFFDFGASTVCVELGDNTDGGWVMSDSQLQPVHDLWATIDRWMMSLVQS
jgi:hypothetical protein